MKAAGGPPGWTLIPMTMEQLPVAAAIHAACFADAWGTEALASMLRMPGAGGALARRTDGTDGGLVLYRVAADEAEILTLCVLPGCRGHRIGTMLLTGCMALAAGAGARRMFLEVAEDNEAGRRLYARAGFAIVGRRPDYYAQEAGAGRAALVLARDIAGYRLRTRRR